MLSDLFVDGTHFEWVLDTLLELHHNHASEDDLLIQYLLPTLCKALAFLKTVSYKDILVSSLRFYVSRIARGYYSLRRNC